MYYEVYIQPLPHLSALSPILHLQWRDWEWLITLWYDKRLWSIYLSIISAHYEDIFMVGGYQKCHRGDTKNHCSGLLTLMTRDLVGHTPGTLWVMLKVANTIKLCEMFISFKIKLHRLGLNSLLQSVWIRTAFMETERTKHDVQAT